MERLNHLLVGEFLLLIALTMVMPRGARADESTIPSKLSSADDPAPSSADDPAKRKPSTYKRLLDELEAERKHVEELEREVRALQGSNAKLQQTTASLQASDQQLAGESSQSQKKIGEIQKTLYSQFGPFNFGDRINSFLGAHTFSMFGSVGAGYYFDHQAGMNQPALHLELGPMIRLNDWINFVGIVSADLEPGGTSAVGPDLVNLEIFPLGREYPIELVAGLTDMPFGDFFENVGPLWVNPFISSPLPFSAESVAPPKSIGLQARGGIQWGDVGQDADYTVWIDSGPSFESAPGVESIPAPVVGEALNELSGINLATNSKGFGARFRLFPLPISEDLGRLELMASTYNGKWLDGLWFNSWDVGFAYRVGPFRTRGEWAESYRQMPNLPAAAAYPGCCGHDNRQGWWVQAGYFLYGIPHPNLGDWLEPRFNKTEFLVRYSGENQRAILANDISTIPQFGFNGSPSVFTPHGREVALALDYWMGPSIVWQNEIDFELPRAGGTLYNFKGSATTPVGSPIGATTNDFAVMTQLAIGF